MQWKHLGNGTCREASAVVHVGPVAVAVPCHDRILGRILGRILFVVSTGQQGCTRRAWRRLVCRLADGELAISQFLVSY